jgi:hypothetical protein
VIRMSSLFGGGDEVVMVDWFDLGRGKYEPDLRGGGE